MPRCANCGTTIIFGGVRDFGMQYCNEKCREKGTVSKIASQIPDDALAWYVQEIHQGACPKCGGSGPVDVHTSYTIWSFAVLTSWQSHPEVCCRRCGVMAQVNGMLLSGAVGWWGLPWGVIGTPIQILRNIGGIVAPPDASRPSTKLKDLVRVDLANQFLEEKREQQHAPPAAT
jgi:hypothetical protein